MRLHRLRLTEVKGVADRCLDLPERGVVVVEGPNEAGKTTMIEALDLLLDEKDSSRKRHVLAMRPVGRDVASTVEAEISTGPYRFTYRKRWFRQPGTELTVTAPHREHLTGNEAHERVRQLLAETVDLALWRALRLMQATPLIQLDVSGSSALAAALDVAAVTMDNPTVAAAATGSDAPAQAADAALAEADTIVAAAEAEYRRYFTAGQGQPTGDYRTARERLEVARQAAAAAQAAVDEVRQDVDRHAVVSAQTVTCEQELAAAKQAAHELHVRWEDVERLQVAAAAADQQVTAAERDAQRAQARWEERRTRAQGLTDGQQTLDEHAAAAQDLALQLAPHEQELAELVAQQQLAQDQARAARRARDEAIARQTRRRDAADLAALADRLRRLDDLASARAIARADLETNRIDKDTLAGLERAAAQIDIARAALTAGSGSVVLTALSGPQPLILDDEPLTLDRGAHLERPLAEPVTVELPGQLRVQVTPEAGAHARAESLRRAEDELARLLEAAGAPDLEHARAAHERRLEAEATLRRITERRAEILAGAREDELADQAALLRESLARGHDGSPAAEPAPTDDDGPDRGETSDTPDAPDVEALTVAADELAAAADDVAAAVSARRESIEWLRVEVTKANSLAEAVGGQLDAERARLQASRAVEPDETLRSAAQQADAELQAARLIHRQAVDALQAHDPTTLQVMLESAEAVLPALHERRLALRDERIAIEARLEAAGGQGRQERLDKALSEQAHAHSEFDAVERRAQAARLLRDTLQRRRSEAKRAYVAPYERELARFGRIVYGSDFEVEVADDLTITARTVAGRRIPFEALSTGAKEQLAILTRLACATLVDPVHGVPVIIDDALGYSDPERLRRICAAFALRGPDTQLILLTCTPGRYAAIPGASVIRL